MQFKTLSVVTATIAGFLFVALLLFPEFMYSLFQIPQTESASFMARRAAILFLTLGILSWLMRNAEHSESRQMVCLSFIIMMFGLAILGTFEYVREYAGVGIGLAIVTELALGFAYLKVYFNTRHRLNRQNQCAQ
ncbi:MULTISPECIES: hypothetical protein [Pseudoalteromonas]|uniref:DUF4345 domain-containing protein n=1 Tax=Pseudoalteromonas luteoviolacea (strain 2ta16) TaxID=1353533 RepID=V4JBP6_PSEL2|nr:MULTISPECIES: hypothetical protein [Pseudoalteromonas]ESP92547.1 hypothetical protein PL2TA16_04140 [Pseudoalteromonas luteoviolacea 2ta16]KZN32733.1 hypothetical protein N483_26900 [Pseudoalteromonas luteoviolacea NCIMB 1944]MCG7550559.1 hypothetical protein [Pseudoalteromonas sp. Of7M-16]